MARSARKQCESQIYHILIRGIGKQILFEDDDDRRRFIDTLGRYKTEQQTEIYAYCLMDNHVHLLLHNSGGHMDLFMKKLEGSYAFYYNHKYGRQGTLFQERYKSEPVDTDAYFSVVFRYILRNPEKAGISSAEDYRWSSYRDYAQNSEYTDTAFAVEYFGSLEELYKYVNTENEDICLEPSSPSLTDSAAREIMNRELGSKSGTVLQSYDREARNAALRKLKDAGLSVRQIERLTGINRGIIQKL